MVPIQGDYINTRQFLILFVEMCGRSLDRAIISLPINSDRILIRIANIRFRQPFSYIHITYTQECSYLINCPFRPLRPYRVYLYSPPRRASISSTYVIRKPAYGDYKLHGFIYSRGTRYTHVSKA